jgi:hypothetical protein
MFTHTSASWILNCIIVPNLVLAIERTVVRIAFAQVRVVIPKISTRQLHKSFCNEVVVQVRVSNP